MPLYEYKCQHCGTRHEQIRPAKDSSAPLSCPTCAAPMVRVLSAPALHFRGAGWTGKSKR